MPYIYSNYHVDLHKISNFDLEQKRSILLAIQAWLPNNPLLPSYLEKRFDAYPYILLAKKNQLIGVFFIDFFSKNHELFLYIGPSFSSNFFAYSAAFMHIFHHYCERYKTVHVLTEAQIWQKGIRTISGNTALSTLVHNALQELKMNDLSYRASQSVLDKRDDKLLFSLGIEESRNAFLSLGFDNKLVNNLRDKFAQIALSPYPVFFVRNFQISARKTL